MDIRFVGQPFATQGQIGATLLGALEDEKAMSLWFATAWAKQSGVNRVRAALSGFTRRGGHSEVVIGIDEGGATTEGLRACLGVFDDVFIYHDPGPRTFHPKIYAVEGRDRAVLVVGSGNLTKGGLFTNYEAALAIAVAREDKVGWEVRDQMRGYFDTLVGAGDPVRKLDEELLRQLEDEGWVTSEAGQNARRASDSRQRQERHSLFGRPVRGLAGAPASELIDLPDDDEDEDSLLPRAPTRPPRSRPVLVVEQWDKVMARGDAQKPLAAGTNPTGALRLSQAGHDIDWRTWFRRVLFGSAPWTSTTDSQGNPTETVEVPLDVTVAGRSFGIVNVRVDHAPHREAGQSNVPTILHWGPILGAILRDGDYHDHTVTISLLSDGSYRLDIS